MAILRISETPLANNAAGSRLPVGYPNQMPRYLVNRNRPM